MMNSEMAINKYGWRKFVTPIVKKVMASSAEELLALNNQMAEDNVRGFKQVQDFDSEKRPVPLLEIDPFTFLAVTACWKAKFSTKLPTIRFLESKWGLPKSDCLEEEHVFPKSNLPYKYYFSYVDQRQVGDIGLLRSFATACYGGDDTEAINLFPLCLNIRSVAVANLTKGLFWLNPERYLALDVHTLNWLQANRISDNAKQEVGSSWDTYLALCKRAMDHSKKKPYELYYDACLN